MARRPDGKWNDLEDPEMGSAGTAFTRNINPKRIRPETLPLLNDPSPREVSLDNQTGIDWVTHTKMKDVLLRHHPELEPALEGIPNAFLPRHKVTPDGRGRRDGKLEHHGEGLGKAFAAINA